MNDLQTVEIDRETNNALVVANAFQITSDQDYVQASLERDGLKALHGKIDETFDDLISGAFKHHRALVAEKKKHAEPLEAASLVYKQKMGRWNDAQKAFAAAEEKRLREEAIKQAEADALEAAAQAEKDGNVEEAQAIISAPVVVPVVVVQKTTPKTSTVFRTNWKYRIVDASKLPREYLVADEVKLGKIARAMQGAVNVPGVEFYSEVV